MKRFSDEVLHPQSCEGGVNCFLAISTGENHFQIGSWRPIPFRVLPPATVKTLPTSQTNPMPTYVLGENIFPAPPTIALTDSYAANLPAGSTVQGIDPNFRTAYISQWNLSIQRSFSVSDSFELDYLGSSGHDLPTLSDPSQWRAAANLFCDLATRPYPQYGLVLYAQSSGNSSYEAFVAKYEHRVTSMCETGLYPVWSGTCRSVVRSASVQKCRDGLTWLPAAGCYQRSLRSQAINP